MVNYLTALHWTWGGLNNEIGLHTLAVQSEAQPLVVADVIASNFIAAFGTSPGPASPRWSTATSYRRCTAARIVNLNTGALDPAQTFNFLLSGTSPNNTPPQCSVGVSLTAGTRPNGSILRGRFYLPPPISDELTPGSSQAAGTLTPTALTNYAAALDNWFDGMISQGITPCVWSRALGTMQPIDSVRVGRVVDTIRARRNGLTEVYAPAWPAVEP